MPTTNDGKKSLNFINCLLTWVFNIFEYCFNPSYLSYSTQTELEMWEQMYRNHVWVFVWEIPSLVSAYVQRVVPFQRVMAMCVCVCASVYDVFDREVRVDVWKGWLAVLTPATLSDLSFVSSHPGPLSPHPLVPSLPINKRTSWIRRRGGHLFYDFFAIFFLFPPSHSVFSPIRSCLVLGSRGPPFISLPGN